MHTYKGRHKEQQQHTELDIALQDSILPGSLCQKILIKVINLTRNRSRTPIKINSTRAKKLITIRSPSTVGPSPKILSIVDKHFCLCCIWVVFLRIENDCIPESDPDKQKLSNFLTIQTNKSKFIEFATDFSSVQPEQAPNSLTESTGGVEIGIKATPFLARWESKLCTSTITSQTSKFKIISHKQIEWQNCNLMR